MDGVRSNGMALRNIAQLSTNISAVKRCQAAEQLDTVIGLPGWLEILERLLFDGAKKVRGVAAGSLKKISITNDKERELVFKASKSRDSIIKVAALECLRSNKESSDRAQNIFLSQLKESSAKVRLAAIFALSEIQDEEVLKAISTRLWDSDITVRVSAAQVLMDIGDSSVVNYFLECFQSSPFGTFDVPKDYFGSKNLGKRLYQVQINADILTFIINQKNEAILDDFVAVLKKSMSGDLNRSLFTVMARIVAPLGETEEILHLWGDKLNNDQQFNLQVARVVEEFWVDENCKEYVEKIIEKLDS